MRETRMNFSIENRIDLQSLLGNRADEAVSGTPVRKSKM